ncbi:hypothetical protein L218DRAFT_925350 [Marasmius fiardii PR-910]|nr:hypothetical protein L218DRAFT_925350 [Marasmius fiardii PR-910]
MFLKLLTRNGLLQQHYLGSFSFSTSRVGLSHLSPTVIPPTTLSKLSQNAQRFRTLPTAWKAVGITGLGMGISLLTRPSILCEPVPPKQAEGTSIPPPYSSSGIPPPPESAVNVYELSFGTVTGICAGVFVKKGAKMVAFVLGGIFVLLQYLGSASIIRIDWGLAAKRFEGWFYTTDAAGVKRPPTVYSLWNALVTFLTADFQARASFLGGFMLGLRLG